MLSTLIYASAEKALAAVLSRPPAEVTDGELECALRLALPECHATVIQLQSQTDAELVAALRSHCENDTWREALTEALCRLLQRLPRVKQLV